MELSFRPLLNTSCGSTRRSSDIFAAIPTDESQKGKEGNGSSDIFDRATMLVQLRYMADMSQKLENIINQNATIIATVKEILERILKR